MNRKNLLITLAPFALIALALFACTPVADCVAEQRNGELTALPTNPDSCYSSSGLWTGVWEEHEEHFPLVSSVVTGLYVNGKKHGKWELRWADSGATGNFVDGKKQGKWELRFADGTVSTGNFVDGKRQGQPWLPVLPAIHRLLRDD